ncbi:DUF4190 domain-containing protein [Bacillus salitolerans]|uniref:DUF4190 domain-containing protein n=1 Tax=Bacillus salitolerans TaxID=1437434 RepID=A0ABW4LR06_9BACI
MANEFSNDEELVNEVNENGNPINVDAYTNNNIPIVDQNLDNEYDVESTPIKNSLRDEEYAAEVAPNIVDFNRRNEATRDVGAINTAETNVDDVTGGRGIGGLALALSILSLFVLPIILGAAGIIIGFVARRRGATALGSWAIGIGAASIIVGIFILPFF